ncbi:MAG: FMN-binding protein [Candidatus Levyibacteriota bacterium]
MKKYLQITVVLGGFFLLVFLKNLRGSDQTPVMVSPNGTTNTNTFIPTATTAPTSAPLQTSSNTPVTTAPATPTVVRGKYKDGTYTGSVEDAFYGNMQVQAVISNGKLSDVLFVQYPNDNRTSLSINQQALSILRQEALQAQSAQVDMVSGASDSSPAFQRSLQNALSQAS